jgi:hypothetical protein
VSQRTACDVLVNYVARVRGSSRGAVLAEMFQSTPLELDQLWLEIAAFPAASGAARSCRKPLSAVPPFRPRAGSAGRVLLPRLLGGLGSPRPR